MNPILAILIFIVWFFILRFLIRIIFAKHRMLKQAIIYNRMGRPLDAISTLNLVFKDNTKNHRALYTKGVSMMMSNRLENAIEYFDKSISRKVTDYALASKWDVLSMLWKNQDAIECYNKALELNNKNILTYNSIADTLMNMERLEEALNYINISLDIEPNNLITKKLLIRREKLNNVRTKLKKIRK